MKVEKPHVVFTCRKCYHQLFLEKDLFFQKLKKVLKMNCPGCGEECGDYFEGIWILTREGNYEKEYGVKDFYEKGSQRDKGK